MTAPVRRAGADLRLLRAAVFAAVCVALSVGGHVLASGGTVPLWSLGAAAVLVLSVAFAAAGRERSLPAIAALLGVGQLGLHCLFALGQHGAGPRTSGAMDLALRLVCDHSGLTLTEGGARRIVADAGVDPDRLAPVTGVAGHAGHAAHETVGHSAAYSLPMLLGHLLAAVAAGWLLRRGEAALFRLVALAAPAHSLRGALRLATALRDGLQCALGAAPAPRPRPDERDEPDTSVVPAHSLSRRGPPAYGLAA
ncbi:hypothetical protein AB0M28_00970 [Streptomyces sp. NPDC051940]|uniref:hypothetical protein n=1 Tax=Streptomyces sp. NPDC051940 TaxID=3155675 RepID=UPI003421C1FA